MRHWELSLGLIKCRIGEISILLVNANQNRKQTNNDNKQPIKHSGRRKIADNTWYNTPTTKKGSVNGPTTDVNDEQHTGCVEIYGESAWGDWDWELVAISGEDWFNVETGTAEPGGLGGL